MEKYIKLVLKAIIKKFMPCSHNPVFIFFKKKNTFFSGSAFLPHVSAEMVTEDETFQKHSPDLNFLQKLFERIDKTATSFPGSFPSRYGGRSMRGPWERGCQKKRRFGKFHCRATHAVGLENRRRKQRSRRKTLEALR